MRDRSEAKMPLKWNVVEWTAVLNKIDERSERSGDAAEMERSGMDSGID